MSTSVEFLEAEVLKFGNADRTRILERLIASLDDIGSIEANWVSETLRREASLAAGHDEMLPGAQTLAQLRARLA